MRITGTIYIITNLVNHKQYVGQTIAPLQKRLNHHFSKYSGCKALSSAIKKYGKENFKVEVLKECSDYFGLNVLEIFYINLFDTLAPNGYNIIEGGKSGTRSAETRKRISQSKQGSKHPMFGKPCSEERKRNISESLKGEKSPWFGKSHSEESKRKMSISSKGIAQGSKHPNAILTEATVKQIKQLLKEGKLSCGQIGKLFSVSRSCISSIKTGDNWSHVLI